MSTSTAANTGSVSHARPDTERKKLVILDGGNQQYTVRNFNFNGQSSAAIVLLWDWGWTWQQISINTTPIGILLKNPDDPTGTVPGSIYLMDSIFQHVGTAIQANQLNPNLSHTSVIILDNIKTTGVSTVLSLSNGKSADVAPGIIDFYLFGNKKDGPSAFGSFNLAMPHPDDSLAPNSTPLYARRSYYVKSRPQYENYPLSSIVDVKSYGAKGDGVTDDTVAIQNALNAATESNVIYFPSGSYIITSTIRVPPICRITGRVWSQLVAKGSAFGSMANPKPMIQVGQPGDTGTVEFSDMLFTSIGALSGLIMVEWNVAASKTGSVGMWDTHFRVGGAIGTKLQVADCPLGQPIKAGCVAASLLLHITPQANGYFENVWAWVADHDLDDVANTQITIAAARGILVESEGPTWLYGTAAEHCMLYQYSFYRAVNTFAGMIQTESPYFQYTKATTSPGTFKDSVGLFNGDPDFTSKTCDSTDLMCDFSWAVTVEGVSNLTIASAGLYSWFDNYVQPCVDTQNCQQRLFLNNGGNEGFRLFNLITIGSVEMISAPNDDLVIYAKDNTQARGHPFWSMLAGYLDDGINDQILECTDDDISEVCIGTPKCDLSRTFDTLDAVKAVSGSFAPGCADLYSIRALQSMLQASVDQFVSANSGYDAVYGYYVEAVNGFVRSGLLNFMGQDGAGNQYFTCAFHIVGVPGSKTTTHQCPITHNEIGFNPAYTITYTLNDSDGFFNALQTQLGIQKDWVKFGVQYTPNPCTTPNSVCSDRGISLNNFPTAADKITVSNPKDTVTAAMANITATQNSIFARELDMLSGQWYGSTNDIVQVVSMPVMMLQQAIEAMGKAKALGTSQKAADQKNLILEILSVVFIFIPFLDDIVPEALAAARIGTLIGDAGSLAITLQDVVSDPSSAPLAILGVLGGAGATLADVGNMAKLASARRGISDDTISGIGPTFKALDGELRAIERPVCRY
jgi:glucan 1,3-beta-glucosidase